MTNQKRGAAKLFYTAKKKWSGAGTGGAKERDGVPEGKGGSRKSTGRRGRGERVSRGDRSGGSRAEQARPARGDRTREPRQERPGAIREESAARGRAQSKEQPVAPRGPRPLPGAMPLNPCVAAHQALLNKALAYPDTYEDRALGQTLVKLKNKNVVIALGREGGGLSLTCKLPRTGAAAAAKFSWASAAGHGLGRKGWVTARFTAQDKLPVRMLIGWVEESYLAVRNG